MAVPPRFRSLYNKTENVGDFGHGQGFVFALGAPALLFPGLPSTPPVTPVTSENFTAPEGGSPRSIRNGSATPQVFSASGLDPGVCVYEPVVRTTCP